MLWGFLQTCWRICKVCGSPSLLILAELWLTKSTVGEAEVVQEAMIAGTADAAARHVRPEFITDYGVKRLCFNINIRKCQVY